MLLSSYAHLIMIRATDKPPPRPYSSTMLFVQRTLLIAAESAAAGMSVNDLKRLAKLAASGDMY